MTIDAILAEILIIRSVRLKIYQSIPIVQYVLSCMLWHMDVDNKVISRRRCLKSGTAVAFGTCMTALAPASNQRPRGDRAVSPFDFGARGDGAVDDTVAFQSAFDAAISDNSRTVHVPGGQYRICKSLHINSTARLSIQGDGPTSVLKHECDEALMAWPRTGVSTHITVQDLAVASTITPKSPTTPAFAFPGGLTFGYFSNVMLDGSDIPLGSGIVINGLTDTCTFRDCVIWRVSGVGIEIGHGSEVRIFGGRIVGINTRTEGNCGIFLRGGNGGVHVSETDLIHVHTAFQIGEPHGKSNREIFLTHVTMDSSLFGLRQFDSSYTSIIGCWAASSDEAQIAIEPSAVGALVTVSGGTIFNGGAYERGGSNHGIVVRAGSFNLQGVSVRHNKGVGILVGAGAKHYVIQGCRIHNNGSPVELRGSEFACVSNILYSNQKPLLDEGKHPKCVQDNVGFEDVH